MQPNIINPQNFCLPKLKIYTHSTIISPHFSLSLKVLVNTILSSVSMALVTQIFQSIRISYTVYLAYVTQHDLRVHPCDSRGQKFILSLGRLEAHSLSYGRARTFLGHKRVASGHPQL